ncbi:glutamyl-tRNA reductase [Crocinitomicaceae bacterium]|nr:glutamyl-tRNA reductase [Crocinitomicaceae bacterium]
MLETLYIHAFTHHNLDVNQIGLLHIDAADQEKRLGAAKSHFACKEMMFLSTCNRVEFTIVSDQNITTEELLFVLYPEVSTENQKVLCEKSEVFTHSAAVRHALSVASSIDSMIVGEREIITQVRSAFETSRSQGLTGDFIRLLTRKVIETAKKVYTETNIAKKPVSVVSLAYHKLKSLNISLDARILIVGAGLTNTTMCKFLKKHGYSNFVVFNRSVQNGNKLASDIRGEAFPLTELNHYRGGFDVLLTCTGANKHLIDVSIYKGLLNGDKERKTIIDIAIPSDMDPLVIDSFETNYVSIDYLQKVSDDNLKVRGAEVSQVQKILEQALIAFTQLTKERNVEIAMKEVPKQVKEIRRAAVSEVFKSDIENMDAETREVFDKVLGYVEKKYISGPMKLAKEIILKNNASS